MGFEINSTGLMNDEMEQEYESDIQEEIIDEEEIEDDGEQPEEIDDSDENMFEFELDDNVEKMSKSDLRQAIDNYRNGTNQDDAGYEEYKQVKPVIEKIKSDNMLQQYMRHSANGHSPDEIIDGMFLQRYPELQGVIRDYYSGNGQRGQQQQQQMEEEIPDFDTTAEEIQYYANKSAQKAIQEALAGLVPNLQQVTQRQQQYESQQTMNNVRGNNDAVLTAALNEQGFDTDGLSNQQLSQIANTMKTLYPGADFKMSYISPEQAKHIVRASLSSSPRNNRASTQDYVRQSTLPRVQPMGASRKNTNNKLLNKLDGFTKDQRLERVNDLFS